MYQHFNTVQELPPLYTGEHNCDSNVNDNYFRVAYQARKFTGYVECNNIGSMTNEIGMTLV